jgi:hypothetical protein
MTDARASANQLRHVPAPTNPVYRLTKLGIDPFEPAPWRFTGNNRFDDPAERFRTIYCASTRAGAFGETLARFRRSLRLIALMADVDDDDESLEDALEGLIDPSDERRGRYLLPVETQLGLDMLGHLR